MHNAEEKFFEDLIGSRGGSQEYDVELAKASTRQPKIIARKTEEEPEVEYAEAPESYGSDVEGQLTIDVYQTANDIVIESAIAGVRPEDIDIDVSSDSITIKGERRRDTRVRDEDYFYQECYWGRFTRSVILPQEVDPDSAHVSLKNGILTVKLPKLNRRRTRKLKVRIE